ncbi:hypothetical protein [Streptomyces apocyni]|uniref:hypothetical protein n=1 Tax=Streptomyces apocyni TaxID=2654677 RepID=UPI0012EA3EFB|nr:hypothetical protein [Streptomyces apocyni]
MPSYYEVMETNLSKLTKAADQWDEMAGEFEDGEAAYERDVHGITLKPSWEGDSAAWANRSFGDTLNEFKYAQREAKAVASLLRDAHKQFVSLRKQVEAIRTEALTKKLKVSEQGVVTFDTTQLDEGSRVALAHDPSYQESVQTLVSAYTQRLNQAVKAVTDADKGVLLALKAVVADANPLDGLNFNKDAKNDIEEYEAEKLADIATRINSGDASPAELREAERSFRDNAGNKAFSQTLLNSLGADGLIKLTNTLNERTHDSNKKDDKQHLNLQKGLATTLATAAKDPNSTFYKEFRAEIRKVGTERFKVDGLSPIPDEKVRGYQSLVTLMQQGRGYSGQFVKDMADDIRKAEEAHRSKGNIKSLWALRDEFSGKDRGWFANDPLDGILDVMSRDPATSTEYLDPKRTDNLKYLLRERSWDTVIDGYAAPPVRTTIDMPIMAEDGDARSGFGAALEAATTGHTPLGPKQDPWPATPHNVAQARIMHHVIGELGPDQSVPENMRQPLSRALASYAADTHEILGGLDSEYITEAGTGHFQKDGETHLAVPQTDLVQFMRGLSEDPEAYGTLHKAESRYIDLSLEQVPKGAQGEELTNTLNKAGTALGVMGSIREDVINDGRMAGYSEADWKSKIAYHVVGGAVTPLYFTAAGGVSIAFGDVIQRGVDVWAWEMGNEMKAKIDGKANHEIADLYLDVNNQLPILIREWANDQEGISDPKIQSYTETALSGRVRGTQTAEKYLTDTTN